MALKERTVLSLMLICVTEYFSGLAYHLVVIKGINGHVFLWIVVLSLRNYSVKNTMKKLSMFSFSSEISLTTGVAAGF